MKSHASLRIVLAITIVVGAMAGCSDSGTNYGANNNGGGNPPPNTVIMSGMTFSPATITVPAGTTITWDNRSTVVHTSTADGGAWDTGNIPAGSSRTTTFNTAGTFPYHCIPHAAMGMRGTVIVQ